MQNEPYRNSYIVVSLKKWLVLIVAVLFSLLIASCSQKPAAPDLLPSTPVYEIDPVFKDIYTALSGEAVLGKLISPAVKLDGLICQYTENALLCFDPSREGLDQYTLAQLGANQNVTNPPDAIEKEADQKVVEGYTLYPEFTGLFDALFGVRFTGRPLSEPVFNVERQRVEQYFENVAMGYDMDSPSGSAYLLKLGVAECGEACAAGSEPLESFIPEISPFVKVLERANGKTLTGEALTKPFEKDGFRYQIFKNVVIYAPLDGSAEATLLPLARLMGMYAAEPVAKQYDRKQGMIFYPFADHGELGFHVPLEFNDFLFEHGGLTLSGAPIAEIVQYEDGAYRQCFETYCLDYDLGAAAEERVRVYPLGMHYLQTLLDAEAVDPSILEDTYISTETIQLLVMEEKPEVSAEASQVIYMAVLRNDFKTPVKGVSGILTIFLPDGKTIQRHFPPTSKEGLSAVSLPPMPNLKSGSVVVYQVCLELPQGSTMACPVDGYLIWNSLP